MYFIAINPLWGWKYEFGWDKYNNEYTTASHVFLYVFYSKQTTVGLICWFVETKQWIMLLRLYLL